MKSIIRKFLSLSLAVVLAAAPLTAFASDALGDELISSNVEVNERTAVSYTHLDVYKRQRSRQCSTSSTQFSSARGW